MDIKIFAKYSKCCAYYSWICDEGGELGFVLTKPNPSYYTCFYKP